MPEEGMVWLPKEQILSFEEIVRVVSENASVPKFTHAGFEKE